MFQQVSRSREDRKLTSFLMAALSQHPLVLLARLECDCLALVIILSRMSRYIAANDIPDASAANCLIIIRKLATVVEM
jgi:hypothetical protein